jgi:hypothetical protein
MTVQIDRWSGASRQSAGLFAVAAFVLAAGVAVTAQMLRNSEAPRQFGTSWRDV